MLIRQRHFEFRPARCCDHFLWEFVPVADQPLGEELFPKVQSELPLMQLHVLSSCPISGHQTVRLIANKIQTI